ncbi:unnamed protein product [Ixodes hexagonus]
MIRATCTSRAAVTVVMYATAPYALRLALQKRCSVFLVLSLLKSRVTVLGADTCPTVGSSLHLLSHSALKASGKGSSQSTPSSHSLWNTILALVVMGTRNPKESKILADT